MAELPVVSCREAIKAFKKIGYQVVRQRGSHFRLHHPERRPITIPNYRRLSKGLLRKILRDAQLSVGEFRALLGD
ncbi:MAG: type II toxin-antitoxin system HicA family toxin [bacterium]|nr:type II toxin-antitoxin system HicA family toxin [bacterium]